MKIDATFEGKVTCTCKNDMRNLANFSQSSRKSQNYDFDGILLSKVENAWSWNLQRSYVLSQWRMTQNLENDWLVVSKLTWGIWRFSTRALDQHTLKIDDRTNNKTFYTCSAKSLFLKAQWQIWDNLQRGSSLLVKFTRKMLASYDK